MRIVGAIRRENEGGIAATVCQMVNVQNARLPRIENLRVQVLSKVQGNRRLEE